MSHRGQTTEDGNQRAHAPGLVVVSGPPASGKTTLAGALATALGYAIADLDTVTGPLTRAALRLSGADEAAIDSPAGAELRAARYETLLDVAAANLEVGLGVVLAAPFTAERSSLERFRVLLDRLPAADRTRGVALVYIDTPDDVLRERLEMRGAARDRMKLLRGGRAGVPPPLVPGAIVIDGTRCLADQVASALDALAPPERRHARRQEAPTC